eukprot:6589488-Pyramimonas_sp.AAC.1
MLPLPSSPSSPSLISESAEGRVSDPRRRGQGEVNGHGGGRTHGPLQGSQVQGSLGSKGSSKVPPRSSPRAQEPL